MLGVGDLVHGAGDYADFTQEYDPSWGRFAAKTYPTSGNHEYCDNRCLDPNAALQNGYFRYWNAKQRTSGARWYSFDVGRWHVVALDSECHRNGGCGPGSPQEQWLRRDLAANPAACTLAYWHRPYYTGGHEREWPAVRGLVQALYDNGAELILNGHQHQYERFHPQTVWRNRDESNGITQIVAVTGGRSHIPPISVRANTVVQNADTFGVLRLELGAQKFSWRFAPAPGHGSFTDAGSRSCH